MINEVVNAFERKDYRTAAALLKQLIKQEPQNPWVQFYIGRLHEETGKLEAAEKAYRQLLRGTTNPKVVSQARQGLGRLEAKEQERRQQALQAATMDSDSQELGVLVLEAIPSEKKTAAAQAFARIFPIDPYSARLQLPSRGWRLYRSGGVGELRFYSQQLEKAEIPCFAASLAQIKQINIFRVHHLSGSIDAPMMVCENEQGQVGSIAFNWSEVSQRVEGMLPIFEEVVDMDVRRNLQRKTKTLDYVPFYDLHLPERGSILRLSDRSYQFQKGISLTPKDFSKTTIRENWNSLLAFFNHHLACTQIWSDFTIFAETAVDFSELLGHLTPQLNLSRYQDTPWDSAFELYSGLVYLKSTHNS